MDVLAAKTLEACIPALAKSSAEKLLASAAKKTRDLWNKAKINWGSAFETYLQGAQERNSTMKTLLYRHEPKPLYDFYEFVDLKRGDERIYTRHVQDVLKQGRNLIIVGMGGIGKTVMLKHFFLDSIYAYEQNNKVPILLELRGLNGQKPDSVDLLAKTYKNMQNYGFQLDYKYFLYALEQGCFLILLDAFDELKEELRAAVTEQIRSMADRYSGNDIILTSRPGSGEFLGWNTFVELESQPLNRKQALSLVQKIEPNLCGCDEAKKAGFLAELKGELYEKYESFVSCPLLLTIMFLVYKNTSTLPTQLVDFYEQAFSTLYHEHDAGKSGNYKREFKCKDLGFSQFKDLFAHFCFKTFLESEYEFTEHKLINWIRKSKEKLDPSGNWTEHDFLHDLRTNLCMLVKDGLHYRFTHRSFQEYFAAYYMAKLDDKQQEAVYATKAERFISYSSSTFAQVISMTQKERLERNFTYPLFNKIRNDYLEVGFGRLYKENRTPGSTYGKVSLGWVVIASYAKDISIELSSGSASVLIINCRGEIFCVLFLLCDCNRDNALNKLMTMQHKENFQTLLDDVCRWLDDYEARQAKASEDPRKMLEDL